MDPAHPLGVAAGEVVVDRDEVDALATEAVEVGRQGGDEGLALAGLHLGDPAEVQRRAAHQLDVEVPLTDDSNGGFTRDGEGLDGDVVEVGAVVEALAELGRLGGELVVGELVQRRLVGVDLGHHRLQRLELLAFAGAEDAVEDSHAGVEATGRSVGVSGQGSGRRPVLQLGRVAGAHRDAEEVPGDEEDEPGNQHDDRVREHQRDDRAEAGVLLVALGDEHDER